MENIDIEFGALQPLFERYSQIVSEDDKTIIKTPFDEAVFGDRFKDALKKIALKSTVGELIAVVDEAKYAKTGITKHRLAINGFGGTIRRVFEEIISFQAADRHDANQLREINDLLACYNKIPETERLGAYVIGGNTSGYYYGGHYQRFAAADWTLVPPQIDQLVTDVYTGASNEERPSP